MIFSRNCQAWEKSIATEDSVWLMNVSKGMGNSRIEAFDNLRFACPRCRCMGQVDPATHHHSGSFLRQSRPGFAPGGVVFIPGSAACGKSTLLQMAHECIQGLDMSKTETFGNLRFAPDGVMFIPGVAACGKSTLLQMIILSLFFGNGPQKSMP